MGNCQDKRSQRTFIDPSSLHQTDIDKLQKGKPIFIQQGLNVKRNPKSNKLQGVPVQWAKKYKLPMEIDMNKTVETRHLPKEIRPSGQLPKNITDFIQRKQNLSRFSSKISVSSSMTQAMQVDKKSRFGIKNLTSNLLEEIQTSQISEDISQPENLMELISLQDQPLYQSKKQHKLLTTDEFRKYLSKVKIQQANPAQKYNFVQEIGKGSMCKVYRVTSKLNENIQWAVKIIKLDEQRTLEKLKNEIAAMQMCYSENIIDYSCTFLYKDSLFIFMQYMSYGSLTSFIDSYKTKIPQGVIAYITFEILKGLGCIHSRWQIHRDLKSDNILINKNGQVKISDFGYALQFTKQKTCCRDVVGTPAWMAPELITKKQYNQSVDIWSLGVIITELVNGEPKYLRLKPLKAMYMIVSEQPPVLDNVSFQLRVFVSKCLQKDPNKRATIKELLNDPFVRNVMSFSSQKAKFQQMLQNSQRT